VKYHADLPAAVDGLERFAEHIRMFLPEDERGRLTASTAHRYKGREREAVIILDANEGCYPLIHPNWVFLRVFGDTLEAIESEERRLFYVTLTRSKKTLVVLAESERRESPYLREIRDREGVQAIEWDELRPVPSLDGERLEVHVSNAYEVRDELAAQGYRWEESQKY
jgi:DNA helicase-4